MADGNLVDFNHRVSRINKAHVKGLGFEAPGTLGRSHYLKRRGFHVPLMAPVFILLLVAVLLKAVIHVHLGGTQYQAKVDRLWTGSALDQVGAVIMQPDPLTIWMAGRLAWIR